MAVLKDHQGPVELEFNDEKDTWVASFKENGFERHIALSDLSMFNMIGAYMRIQIRRKGRLNLNRRGRR